MAKAVYTAHAVLKSGACRVRDFRSQKNAIAWARQIANENGACRVTRATGKGFEVVFHTSQENACA